MGDPWWVYLVRCGDGSLYCGITIDVQKRLAAHRTSRGSKYVQSRLPCSLAWVDPLPYTKSGALSREAAIKRMRKRDKERLACTRGQMNFSTTGDSPIDFLVISA